MLGESTGDDMERVDTREACGEEGDSVEIPVLPNPPSPRDVSEMMDVVSIVGDANSAKIICAIRSPCFIWKGLAELL